MAAEGLNEIEEYHKVGNDDSTPDMYYEREKITIIHEREGKCTYKYYKQYNIYKGYILLYICIIGLDLWTLWSYSGSGCTYRYFIIL